MDKSVSRTLLLRIWSIVSGLIVVLAIPFFLTAEQQGFYYSFSSLVAIQIFFELGLSQVLIYKFADLYQKASSPYSPYLEKINSLLFSSRIIYRVLAALFFIVGSFAGILFFRSTTTVGVEWQFPWLLLVSATSINLAQSVKLAFMESIGNMHHVSVARLRANAMGTILFIFVIFLGGGLWSASVIPMVNAIYLTLWLYGTKTSLKYRIARRSGRAKLKELMRMWHSEVFPLQWRISLSWISGYMIFQLYTPIAMRRFGAVDAGRLGYSIAIISAIVTIGSTFTSAIAPRLSALYSAGELSDYNATFDRSFRQSAFLMLILLILVNLAVYLCSLYLPAVSERLLSVTDTIAYSIAAYLSGVILVFSIYLRSQQKEPLLALSLVASLLMSLALFIGSSYSLSVMLIASLCVQSLAFAWCLIIVRENRVKLTGVAIS
jgi:O-antigen/teichoic acid export membrane protein